MNIGSVVPLAKVEAKVEVEVEAEVGADRCFHEAER